MYSASSFYDALNGYYSPSVSFNIYSYSFGTTSPSQLNQVSGLGGLSQATKADPEIELRFLLRQFNKRQ
ncbi:MAG: hypothetical protein EZS28_009405 [Streblomastix strix]|uniref:Uncharacterized protein n=1 Tax=Streblomastix strix TaxID=222440 RepID=A0A5J4WL73_9EUKA|nr:MAG: hypothetical protein EZS28_009405 [Streblomastix strix]